MRRWSEGPFQHDLRAAGRTDDDATAPRGARHVSRGARAFGVRLRDSLICGYSVQNCPTRPWLVALLAPATVVVVDDVKFWEWPDRIAQRSEEAAHGRGHGSPWKRREERGKKMRIGFGRRRRRWKVDMRRSFCTFSVARLPFMVEMAT